ncbi:hypothetical protein JNE38_09840 [Brevibacillus choshinensis]|uniref:SPOR domain-containing protein n=1 Tax=Brevibacillus choshinensis TaxID=54911 RepID=A0ABX7FVU1_BRECH|nr:hypothetical protein JNE38_09840 [Brevibacillus choshinensis]
MSGEKRSNVTVKMNGRFWDGKQESTIGADAGKDTKGAAKKRSIPFPSQPLAKQGNEAWDRMIELRDKAEQQTVKEQDDTRADAEPVQVDVEESVFSKTPATRLFSGLPKGPFVRTVVSTGGAIAIGLLFGFLVLTVFSEKELSNSYRNVLGDTVETLTAQNTSGGGQTAIVGPVLPGINQPAADASSTQAAGTQADANVLLPEWKMFVAQAGVFNPDTAAEAATAPLDKLSLPHFLYKDSAKQYMFAAAAPTRDAVLGFAASLKNKGVEVYVKEFTLPAYQGKVAVTTAASSGAQPNLQQFFENGQKLAQTLSDHSGKVITNAQPVLPQEEAAAMKEQHRQFLEQSRLVSSQSGGSPYISGMVAGINQAMDARDKMAEANAGKKSQSAESYAWQVQAGILGFLENYAAWIQQAQKTE